MYKAILLMSVEPASNNEVPYLPPWQVPGPSGNLGGIVYTGKLDLSFKKTLMKKTLDGVMG